MKPRVVKTEAAEERLTPPAATAGGGGGARAPAVLIELSSSESDSDGEGGGGGSAKRSRGAGGEAVAGKRARISAAAATVDVPPGFLDPLPLPPPATCATKQFWKAGDYDGKPPRDGAPQPSGFL